jgi:hypothetical protein
VGLPSRNLCRRNTLASFEWMSACRDAVVKSLILDDHLSADDAHSGGRTSVTRQAARLTCRCLNRGCTNFAVRYHRCSASIAIDPIMPLSAGCAEIGDQYTKKICLHHSPKLAILTRPLGLIAARDDASDPPSGCHAGIVHDGSRWRATDITSAGRPNWCPS